jgi:hypothetical protein
MNLEMEKSLLVHIWYLLMHVNATEQRSAVNKIFENSKIHKTDNR